MLLMYFICTEINTNFFFFALHLFFVSLSLTTFLLFHYCIFINVLDDHSRVKLHVDDKSLSDYINANYIDACIHNVKKKLWNNNRGHFANSKAKLNYFLLYLGKMFSLKIF